MAHNGIGEINISWNCHVDAIPVEFSSFIVNCREKNNQKFMLIEFGFNSVHTRKADAKSIKSIYWNYFAQLKPVRRCAGRSILCFKIFLKKIRWSKIRCFSWKGDAYAGLISAYALIHIFIVSHICSLPLFIFQYIFHHDNGIVFPVICRYCHLSVACFSCASIWFRESYSICSAISLNRIEVI